MVGRRDPLAAPTPEPGAPSAAGHEDAERQHSDVLYLGDLAGDPPNIPDDGVARVWATAGKLWGSVGGVTYQLLPPL